MAVSEAILCQGCGIEAPTRYVEFHQNIGALVLRFHRATKGHLCKRCIHSQFWSRTTMNVLFGPWGVISMIVTPVFLLMNVGYYIASAGLPKPGPEARRPLLNDAVIAQLAPHATAIFDRLNMGRKLNDVAREIGAQAGVTPGTVIIYAAAIARQQQEMGRVAQAPVHGFPVMAAGAPGDAGAAQGQPQSQATPPALPDRA